MLTSVASFFDGLPARPLARELRFDDDADLATYLADTALLSCPPELLKPPGQRDAAALRKLRLLRLDLQGAERVRPEVLATWAPSLGRVLSLAREDQDSGPRITFDYAFLVGGRPHRLTATGTYEVFGATSTLLGLVQETSAFLVLVSPNGQQHMVVLEQPPLSLELEGIGLSAPKIAAWLRRQGAGRVLALWRGKTGPKVRGARVLDVSDFPNTDCVIDPRAWPAVEAFDGRPRSVLAETYTEYRNDALAKAFSVLPDDEPVFFVAEDPQLALNFCCYVRSIRRAQRRPVWYVLAATGDWRQLA